ENSGAPGTLPGPGGAKAAGGHRGEGGPVKASAFSPGGQRLLTASEDGGGMAGRPGVGLLWRLSGHTGPVKVCRFSLDGRLFATTSCDYTIRLWDTAEAKCLHQRSVGTVSFSPDSTQLASGAQGSLLQSGQMLHHLGGHRDSVQSSDFAPSSDSLATGSWDSTISIWDLRMATPVIFHQELEGHSGNISCLCYSASGLLASGSWDKTIHIWKPSTRSLLVQLKGHVTWVKSIAFSPDGSQLASAGYSHMVKVWDCNTGKCIETLKIRPGVLDVAHACAFTPDGKLLVSVELLIRQDTKSTA
uniref:WD repeat domain 38 n=2 Tax=Canis lupus familiaris TaxID=9615 RepID=A0A8C0RDN5_CANLF